jgi:hypothetical protein
MLQSVYNRTIQTNNIEDITMSHIQVRINRNGENDLRELGWSIPQYPETGMVLFDGKSVGWVDNFAGLVVKDSLAIDWLKAWEDDLPNMVIWNKC